MYLIKLGDASDDLVDLDLDNGSDYRLLSIDFNAPPTEIHEVSGALADANLQADVRTSAYRDIVISVAVTGADKSGLLTNLEKLANQIAKNCNILKVQPNDAAYAVVFKIGKNPEPEFPWDQASETALVTHVTFALKAEPYAYEAGSGQSFAVETIGPISYACPALNSLHSLSISGERRVPVGLTIQKAPTSGSNIHCLYVAPVTTSSLAHYFAEPANTAWNPQATVMYNDSAAHNGTYCKLLGQGPTNPNRFSWDVTNTPEGRYRLLARAKVTVSDNPGTLSVKDPNDSAAGEAASTSVDSTAWRLYDMGEVDVPQRARRSGSSALEQLQFTGTTSTGSGFLCIDYFVLVPVASLFRFHPSDDTDHADTVLSLNPAGVVCRDDYVNFDSASGQTMHLDAGESNILIVSDDSLGQTASQEVTLTVEYTPRFVLWAV